MPNNLRDQCWALAGIAQASHSVQNVALGKAVDEGAAIALYKALLEQTPDSIQSLMDSGDFSLGLRSSEAMLHRPNEEQIQTLRYTLAILDATSRLRHDEATTNRLAERIAGLDGEVLNLKGFSSYDIPWEDMADIYVDTLGQLNQRIQVRGNSSILQRRDIASKVRGLLLMGVRFAWLWHQLGGRRWHLLINRRRMWQTTQLLSHSGTHSD